MQLKLIDNFLSPIDFTNIRDLLFGSECPWSRYKNYDDPNNDQHQFGRMIFAPNVGITDHYSFEKISSICNQIGQIVLMRIKVNLNTKTYENEQLGPFHTDFPISDNFTKTALFYVNTNNGFTLFEDGTKIDSVANRLIIFDSNQKHVGYSCTDKDARVVINLNYIPIE